MTRHSPTIGSISSERGAARHAGATDSASGDVPDIPIGRVALWTAGAALAVGLIASAALLPLGHAFMTGSALAMGCVLAGIAAQLGSAAMLPARTGPSWAMLALFGHGVRLGISLALGLWAMMLFGPDRVGFWTVFLAASLAAIVAEAALIIAASRRLPICVVGRGAHQ